MTTVTTQQGAQQNTPEVKPVDLVDAFIVLTNKAYVSRATEKATHFLETNQLADKLGGDLRAITDTSQDLEFKLNFGKVGDPAVGVVRSMRDESRDIINALSEKLLASRDPDGALSPQEALQKIKGVVSSAEFQEQVQALNALYEKYAPLAASVSELKQPFETFNNTLKQLIERLDPVARESALEITEFLPPTPKVDKSLARESVLEITDFITPSLTERFKHYAGETFGKMQNIEKLRVPHAAAQKELEAVESQIHKVSLWSAITSPIKTVKSILASYKVDKVADRAARAESNLETATNEYVAQTREKFAGSEFKLTPEIPAIFVRASIPAAKQDSLLAFDELAQQVQQLAEGKNATLAIDSKRRTISLTVGDHTLVYKHQRDGKVSVAYNTEAGTDPVKQGSLWTDDALKAAIKLLNKGEVTFNKKRWEDRIIPAPDYLARKSPAQSELSQAA